MSGQVKVEDLEVFAGFRIALLKFAQAADSALSNADSQISRTHSWLDTEQRSFWELQLRKRGEAVMKAHDAVRQKKMYNDPSGRRPTAVEEEKALAKCVKALEEGQQKLDNVKRALPRLEKAADLYRSGVARLSITVTVDIPRAVALLDRLSASLQEYVQIEAPSMPTESAAAASPSGDSVSRGGDEGMPPAAESQETPPASSAEAAAATPQPTEARDVAHGQ